MAVLAESVVIPATFAALAHEGLNEPFARVYDSLVAHVPQSIYK